MSVDLSLIPEITWPERPEIIR
ncbi:tail fiber assembly protein [Escherichia coli]|nr:tail fiber assembly protein [Escherichia coli]